MRRGTALTLALDVAPYALVAVAVFTAAFGAPVLTRLCAVVLATYAGNAVLGECDLASWALGDAPRSAYRGKTVWITGASQGLGEELALHLGSMGARLILSSRREETLRRVCEAATAAGAEDARALTLDARAGSAAMREKGAAALALAREMAGAGDGVDGTDADSVGLHSDRTTVLLRKWKLKAERLALCIKYPLNGEPGRIVVDRESFLLALLNSLGHETTAIKQPDGNQGELQVARGFQMIARKHAQATAIDR